MFQMVYTKAMKIFRESSKNCHLSSRYLSSHHNYKITTDVCIGSTEIKSFSVYQNKSCYFNVGAIRFSTDKSVDGCRFSVIYLRRCRENKAMMVETSNLLGSSSVASLMADSGPANFLTKANAILRKNLTYQVQRSRLP
ncbi:hypothetical protein YC2023_010578 [Brassica napus]